MHLATYCTEGFAMNKFVPYGPERPVPEVAMSQEAVERVLGRLITDACFRRAVGDSLEAACVQHGYSLSPTELRFLSELEMKEIDAFAARINPGLCRADTPFS